MSELHGGSIFPFFDHISQNVDLPGAVCAILFVWFTLQNLLTNLWVPGNPLILSFGPLTDMSRFLFYIGSFSDLELTETTMLIVFIVTTVVFVLTIGVIALLLVRYGRSRTFIAPLMIPARILLEILPLTMVFPSASITAHSLMKVLDGESGPYFVFFAFGAIDFIGFLSIFGVSITLLGSSPFLPEGPFCFFSPIAHRNHVIGVSICFLCSIISSRFDSWFMMIVVFAHICDTLFILWQFSSRPFIDNWCNCFHVGFCVYMILMDIATVVIRFWDPTQGMIYFCLIFILAVVAGVATWFYWRFSSRRLSAILAAVSADEQMSDDAMIRVFDELHLNRSPSYALYVLDYAVTQHCMRLFDFGYMKYITSTFRDSHVLVHCARITSWLPYYARPLSFLCNSMVQRRDLTLADRFILFQLERIRICRESSSSNTATEKLMSAKTVSSEMSQIMRSFWEHSECSLALLNVMASRLSSADSLWHEVIDNFPNSLQFRDLYITYLIESATRYSEAVFQKSRAEMIETGVSFRVDNCFRRFVARHPAYLKRRIMDTKGNSIKAGVSGTSASSQGNHTSHGSTGAGGLDAALEENIGRCLFGQARVRLTMERAFAGRTPRLFPLVVASAVIQVVVSFIVFIYVQVYFQTYFDDRIDVLRRIRLQDVAVVNYYMSTICWVYYWGTNKSIIDYDGVINSITPPEDMTAAFIPNDLADWDLKAAYFNQEARTGASLVSDEVVMMAQTGLNITKYATPYFARDAIPIFLCSWDGHPLFTHTSNFRTIFSYLLLVQAVFEMTPIDTWFSTAMCPCVTFRTLHILPEPFEAVRTIFSSQTNDLYEAAVRLLGPMKWWLPLTLCGFCVLMWLPATILYVREVHQFTTMLLGLPKAVKRECMKPLRRDCPVEDHEGQGLVTTPGYNLAITFNAIILAFIGVTCVINILQALNIENVNITFGHINTWLMSARSRKNRIAEGLLAVLIGVLSNNHMTENTANISEPYFTAADADFLASFSMEHLQAQNRDLMQDSQGASVVGLDTDIDRLTLEPLCESEASGGLHDTYRCGSGQLLMEFFDNAVRALQLDWKQTDGKIDTSIVGHLIHLIDRHLMPVLSELDEHFAQLTFGFRDDFIASHQLYTVGAILLQAFVVVLILWYHHTIVGCYNVLLALLRRVPPAHIIASEPLEQYLLNTSSSKKRVGMSTDERIIDAAADCIILCGPTKVIDMINPAVTELFGYNPEQLLGQPLASLLVNDNGDGADSTDNVEKLDQQMKLMAGRQSAATYEGHVTCLTDDDTEIPCLITLLALFHGDDVSAFVAILRDESAILQQEEEAELAKRQSETLLYQILPRDIVVRLNAGEKDISFSIPSATIMFIDIVEFSEYATHLTPPEIMGNLSLIFASFDEACAKYPLLIKIKLIGDVYMCAGGLFTPDMQPSAHAEQMVRFAIDAVQIIEDVNVKLNSVLAVRIGINSGGPILAGVLGTDRPTFDIIGDSINVAARLQSTDQPGKIQISESTQELLFGLEFQMECRGEIELKGKGKQKTFLINPTQAPAISVSISQSTLEDITRLMPT